MWWIYFSRAKPLLDHALESRRGREQSALARDAFSLFHFPIIGGIIASAAVIEAAISHSHDPLPLAYRATLAAALLLYIGGMSVAAHRAAVSGFQVRALIATLIATLTAMLVIVVGGVTPAVTLGTALSGMIAVAMSEQFS
jgi:low temperature requirement protein LtrA